MKERNIEGTLGKSGLRKTHPDCASIKIRPYQIHLSLQNATNIFREIRRESDSPWIFPGRNPEKPVSDVYRFWNRIRNEVGMPEIRIHDLRHTFASYIVADGHTLYVAQQLLGHSDLRTTMRYAHFAQTTLLAAVGTLDQILERNEPLGKSGIAPEEEGAPRGADSATSHSSRQKHEKM